MSASGSTLYERFGRPSKAPGSSGGSENAVSSMTTSPRIDFKPALRKALTKLHQRSNVMYGSPPPCRIKSPSSTPSLNVPLTHAEVSHVKGGPSMSKAAKVVTVLIVDAGLRGVSGFKLITT